MALISVLCKVEPGKCEIMKVGEVRWHKRRGMLWLDLRWLGNQSEQVLLALEQDKEAGSFEGTVLVKGPRRST